MILANMKDTKDGHHVALEQIEDLVRKAAKEHATKAPVVLWLALCRLV